MCKPRLLIAAGVLPLIVPALKAQAAADPFYPAAERAEKASIAWPRLLEQRADSAVLDVAGARRSVTAGARAGDFEVLAILGGVQPLLVLERQFADWGVLAYIGRTGPVAVLRKAVGRLESLQPDRVPFPRDYYDRLLSADQDLLGNKVLASGRDPSYGAVSGLLPPFESYTFLGTVSSKRKPILTSDGRIGWGKPGRQGVLVEVLFDPWRLFPDLADVRDNSDAHLDFTKIASKKGLVGGYLPAIDFGVYEARRKSGWEQIAYAAGEEPEIRVALRAANGTRRYWRNREEEPDGSGFYRGLLEVSTTWEKFFAGGSQFTTPEPRVDDSAKGSIVRALITNVGVHPKYGVGMYEMKEHDTFPPSTFLLNTCLLEWGFTAETRDRLGYYLSRFVKDDGTFEYYGPAVSEYGQMMTLAARYVLLTGDYAWLKVNAAPLERIAARLIAERAANRAQYAPDSPQYGLLFGAAEADNRKETDFYFSSDAWVWRGLVEMGRLLRDHAGREMEASYGDIGTSWLAEASGLQKDTLVQLRRSFRTDVNPPFLPPVSGMRRVFTHMTEDRFSSYSNYRYWLEMLSPGLLPPEMRDAIIGYRVTHGGEILGTTRISEHLNDWPFTHYAWSLLDAARIRQYQLAFYTHIAHHQEPGTFTVNESVPTRGEARRVFRSDYCVPAQLIAPQLLRWMSVWEPWDKQELWIARAVPDRWFDEGFSATGVPTRWGPVSFNVRRSGAQMLAAIEMPSPHAGVTVNVRLAPAVALAQVRVAGAKQWSWDREDRVLRLAGDWKKVTITAR